LELPQALKESAGTYKRKRQGIHEKETKFRKKAVDTSIEEKKVFKLQKSTIGNKLITNNDG